MRIPEFGITPNDLTPISVSNPDVDNSPEHAKLLFRGFNSKYWNGKEITQRSGYRLLKRASCRGCPTCDYIFDEALQDYFDHSDDLGEIEHGATYELKLVKELESWEYPNSYYYVVDIEMVLDKYGKEPKKGTTYR